MPAGKYCGAQSEVGCPLARVAGRAPASPSARCASGWRLDWLDLDPGVGECRGVAEVGEYERGDRVDRGVAFRIFGPGSHRCHDHSGGDLVGDPGQCCELTAVVEHADVLPVGDAAL